MSEQRIYEEEIVYGAVTSSNSEEIATPEQVFNKDGEKITFSGKLHLTEKEYEKFKRAKQKKDKLKEKEEEEKEKKEKQLEDSGNDLII